MYRHIFILLIFNFLSGEILDVEMLERNKPDLILPQDSEFQMKYYRDEEELLQFIQSTIETHLIAILKWTKPHRRGSSLKVFLILTLQARKRGRTTILKPIVTHIR